MSKQSKELETASFGLIASFERSVLQNSEAAVVW
jgi:hypothetical protein